MQDLLITKEDWFAEYKKIAVESCVIQRLWAPAIGDWMERLYTLNMEPIVHKEERVIEMLCYKSTARGYWHVTGADGQSRIWNSEEEIAKKTCKWIPRLDQLIMPFYDKKSGFMLNRSSFTLVGDVGEIHISALKSFILYADVEEPC